MSEQDDANRLADSMNMSDIERLADAMRLAGTRSLDDANKLVADFRKDDAKKLDAIKSSSVGEGIDGECHTPLFLVRARWENRFPARKLTHAALIEWLYVEHGMNSFESDKKTMAEIAELLEIRQLVTLDQSAAIVNKSKATLRRNKEKLPTAAIKGIRGQTEQFYWDEMRPHLEEMYPEYNLPVRYPRLK